MFLRIAPGQRGEAVVIIALAMVTLVGFAALAVDGGYAYAQARLMQKAADAGALAGAQALASGGSVQAATYEYAGRNGVDTSDPANIAWSYVDEGEEHVGVMVTTSITFPTFLASVVDVPSMSASGNAVALLVTVSSFDWALFANNPYNDRAIHMNGNNLYVGGNAHSNGGIRIDGDNHTIDGAIESVGYFHVTGNNNTWGSPFEVTDSGGYLIEGSNNSYPPLRNTANTEEMPEYFLQTYGPDRPDWVPEADWHYHSGDWSFAENNKTLTGVYYVEGDITLKGNNLGGQATFVATGNIQLRGMNYDFTTYDGEILLFANGSIEINGNDMGLSGIIYAPQGQVSINGNSLSTPIGGSVIADTIEISGNNANVISYNSGYFPTEEIVRLVE